jgi:hypothetical protein
MTSADGRAPELDEVASRTRDRENGWGVDGRARTATRRISAPADTEHGAWNAALHEERRAIAKPGKEFLQVSHGKQVLSRKAATTPAETWGSARHDCRRKLRGSRGGKGGGGGRNFVRENETNRDMTGAIFVEVTSLPIFWGESCSES